MDKIEDEIVMGGWRCMCIGVLLNAIKEVEAQRKLFKERCCHVGRSSGPSREKLWADSSIKKWLDGGVGVITFEDCCSVMDLDPDRARQMILIRARNRRRMVELTDITGAW